jgi:hypothetical protein
MALLLHMLHLRYIDVDGLISKVDIIPASSFSHSSEPEAGSWRRFDFASTSDEHSSISKTSKTHLNMAESSDKIASTASEDAQPKTEQQPSAPGEVCPAPPAL